jgi:capsule biosynthesis phosphatase
MNIVVPMMGHGQRFKDVGYDVSKPLIKAAGKEVLFWLLDSLDCSANNVLIVCRDEHENHRLTERIRARYHDSVSLMYLTGSTEGAAHTLQIALESQVLDLNAPLAVCDSDTFYGPDHVEKLTQFGKNAVFCFHDDGTSPIYSYVQLSQHDSEKIDSIREKVKISDWASVGTYCFQRAADALEHCRRVRSSGVTTRGEYYVSSVIQSMIDDGHVFYMQPVGEYHCLGTPSQLQGFTTERKMRFCFDLDNTLVSEPKIAGDYSSVSPISKNIDYLKHLYEKGHEIIISTSRRMRTHKGNVSAAVADIGKITFDTLSKFEIPYDEIHFGKPYADFYIDDKAINSWSDLEKATGVYRNDMISREHNRLEEMSGKIVKSSDRRAIRGELFWYQNIPADVSDLFPTLRSFSEESHVLTLELDRIDGPTFSKMLTIGSLKNSHIDELCVALDRIHATQVENEDVDIYSNYRKKFEKRYHSWSDSVSEPWIEDLYTRILRFLERYEQSDRAQRRNIHGDPVFTNIMVDKNNRLKMIDMRGLQGETLTLTGDENYDYAKVYQSLAGYDFLIRDMEIKEQTLLPLRARFLQRCKTDEKTIAGLAASLIFSCIPLQPDSIKRSLVLLSERCAKNAGLYEEKEAT